MGGVSVRIFCLAPKPEPLPWSVLALCGASAFFTVSSLVMVVGSGVELSRAG